ncbi:MAG: hypothetical protein JNJ54_20745 [Myxococcaceae bacterium]|nr:hypothetical protein [Myxococcaceae bacterium]
MTSQRDRATQYLEEARAHQPSLDPRRREHLKQAVLAGVAGATVAASSASAAGGWFAGVGVKVVLGVTAAAVGSGLTYGVMRLAPVVAAEPPSVAGQGATAQAAEPVVPAPVAEPMVPLALAEPVVPLALVEPAVAEPVAEQGPRAAQRPMRVIEAEARPSLAPIRAAAEETPPIMPSSREPATKPVGDRPAEVATSPGTRHPSASAATTALDEELAQLRKAMALHEAEDETGAAAVLAAYEDRFPRGLLRVEALTLRVLVACARGRTDEADDVWRLLEREAPHVLSTPRLQQSCAHH